MGNTVFKQNEVNETPAFGFRYRPNQGINYGPVGQSTAGIIVGWPKEALDQDVINLFVTDSDSETPPLFALPAKIDANWRALMKQFNARLAADDDFLKRSQGFLEFCYASLQALYKTACGKRVIDFFAGNEKGVGINPAAAGNSIAGASSAPAFPILVQKLLDSKARFSIDGDGLIALVSKRFPASSADASLADMAGFMNQQPLYTLFKAPPYEFNKQGFLAYNFPIRTENLKDWFSNGNASEFAKVLQNGIDIKINGVSCHDFTRLMAVVALEREFTAGNGCPSSVRFNVLKTEMNQSRPAAIGLGHEMIHAYWAANGRQLGYELYTPSTLLFEMKCVGLGPWADSDISENRLRSQWSAANKVAVARRKVYDQAQPDDDQGRLKIRQESRTI
jgi:hypothetical protein